MFPPPRKPLVQPQPDGRLEEKDDGLNLDGALSHAGPSGIFEGGGGGAPDLPSPYHTSLADFNGQMVAALEIPWLTRYLYTFGSLLVSFLGVPALARVRLELIPARAAAAGDVLGAPKLPDAFLPQTSATDILAELGLYVRADGLTVGVTRPNVQLRLLSNKSLRAANRRGEQ